MSETQIHNNHESKELNWVKILTLIVSILTLCISSYLSFHQSKLIKRIELSKIDPKNYYLYLLANNPGFKGYKTIRGVAYSSDGKNGLENVDVLIVLNQEYPISTKTNENGLYEVEIPIFKDTLENFISYTILALKNGYQPYTATCPLDQFPQGCNVFLSIK